MSILGQWERLSCLSCRTHHDRIAGISGILPVSMVESIVQHTLDSESVCLKETYITSTQIPLAKASRVAGKYSGTMCLDGERNPGTVSTVRDSTMGKEGLRLSENSSPGSRRMCISRRGTAGIQPTTPEAPVPIWKHSAPNQGSLLQ